MIPFLYKERSSLMLKSTHGEATFVGVDFSDSFLDSSGECYVCVLYSLLEDEYKHTNFYVGYWKKSYIEEILK